MTDPAFTPDTVTAMTTEGKRWTEPVEFMAIQNRLDNATMTQLKLLANGGCGDVPGAEDSR